MECPTNLVSETLGQIIQLLFEGQTRVDILSKTPRDVEKGMLGDGCGKKVVVM